MTTNTRPTPIPARVRLANLVANTLHDLLIAGVDDGILLDRLLDRLMEIVGTLPATDNVPSPASRPATAELSIGSDPIRVELWSIIDNAIWAGCPVPVTVYLARDGKQLTVTVATPADVAIWAHYLGIGTITTSIYPTGDGGWQRTIEANSNDDLIVHQHDRSVRGPAAVDSYPVLACENCGTAMTAHLPSISVLPGESVRYDRPYHCPACRRWHHREVTDLGEQYGIWELADLGVIDLYPPAPTDGAS